MKWYYFFFGTASLSWVLALVLVFFLRIGLPELSIYNYTTALVTDVEANAVLFGFTAASFVFFLREVTLRENGKMSSQALVYIVTALWSFFWSFLFGFRVLEITESPATSFQQVLPFSFTLVGVFVMLAFLVQVTINQKEKSTVGKVMESKNATN